MTGERLRELLEALASGASTVDEVQARIEGGAFLELGGGLVMDAGRRARTGAPEVVYSEGKDRCQIERIAAAHVEMGEAVLFTRVLPWQVEVLHEMFDGGRYNDRARIFCWYPDGGAPDGVSPGGRSGRGEHSHLSPEDMVVVAAGASDAAVAEEVVETTDFLAGFRPLMRCDCGVAGIHRLLARMDDLARARVVVAVAGMDGVLPTVVAGLVKAPVIAVPTSVGYGPAAGGLTPLLTMLSSCAPGLVVVNVDNGVGAAFAATRILVRGQGLVSGSCAAAHRVENEAGQ